MTTTAKAYSISGDVALVAVRGHGLFSKKEEETRGATRDAEEKQQQGVVTCVVLDKSGSMRSTMETAVVRLRSMLKKETKNPVEFFTFNTRCDYRGLITHPYKKLDSKANGGTSMSDVLPCVQSVLEKPRRDPVRMLRLIILTDGKISDMEQTIQSAKGFQQYIYANEIVCRATCVRWDVCGYGSVDTRGLSAIMASLGNGELITVKQSAGAMQSTRESQNERIVRVSGAETFRNLHTSESTTNLNTLVDIDGDDDVISFLVKRDSSSLGNIHLSFEGNKAVQTCDVSLTPEEVQPVTDAMLLDETSDVRQFLDRELKALRIMSVANNDTPALESALKTLTEMRGLVQSVPRDGGVTDRERKTRSAKWLKEMAQRVPEVEDVLSQAIDMLRKGIAGSFASMTSNDQASFINSTVGKAVAKRSMVEASELMKTLKCETLGFAKFLTKQEGLEQLMILGEDFADVASYITCSTTGDEFAELHDAYQSGELEQALAQAQTPVDILRLFNIVGYGVSMKAGGDCQAPMNQLYVEDVFPTFVATSDFYNGFEHEVPGMPGKVMNGCAAILPRKLFEYMILTCPTVLQCIAGVMVRKNVVPVPLTMQAVLCKSVLHLMTIDTTGRKEFSEGVVRNLFGSCGAGLSEGSARFRNLRTALQEFQPVTTSVANMATTASGNDLPTMYGMDWRSPAELVPFIQTTRPEVAEGVLFCAIHDMVLSAMKSVPELSQLDDWKQRETRALEPILKTMATTYDKKPRNVPSMLSDPARTDTTTLPEPVWDLTQACVDRITQSPHVVTNLLFVSMLNGVDESSTTRAPDVFRRVRDKALRLAKCFPALQSHENLKRVVEALIVMAISHLKRASVICEDMGTAVTTAATAAAKEPIYLQTKVPSVLTQAGVSALLMNVIKKQFYENNVKKQHKKRLELEYEALTQYVIDAAIDAEDVETFNSLLKEGVAYYGKRAGMFYYKTDKFDKVVSGVVSKYSGSDQSQLELGQAKMKVLCFGRHNVSIDEETHELRGNIVINNGAPSYDKRDMLKTALEALGTSPEEVEQIMVDMKRTSCRHRYRPGMKNRHNHSDEHPSMFAVGGYRSMKEMAQDVTEEELETFLVTYIQYCLDHNLRVGCGIPKYLEEEEYCSVERYMNMHTGSSTSS